MPRFDLVPTLDYELPNDRFADVNRYIVDPTYALLDACNSCNAKLTIMLDICELWAFESGENHGFSDALGYKPTARIKEQLIEAVQSGHDVQLHLHPQWLGARFTQGRWHLDYSKYSIHDFDTGETVQLLQKAKQYLETLFKSSRQDYRCLGFRAGNWITQPSEKYLRSLYEAGFKSDTSVFKWGHIDTDSVHIDYRDAYSNVLPWVASWNDINKPSVGGEIIEFPIYSEPSHLFGLFSFKRLIMALGYLREDRAVARQVRDKKLQGKRGHGLSLPAAVRKLTRVYPKKFDFCKLTSREQIQMINRIIRHDYGTEQMPRVPVIMIGHSKDLEASKDFSVFLKYVSENLSESVGFKTYREVIDYHSRNIKS